MSFFVGDPRLWEVRYITHDGLEDGFVGYIQGPPVTALTTAAGLCRQWNYLSIHARFRVIWRFSGLLCLQGKPGYARWEVKSSSDNCESLIGDFGNDRKSLLVIAGVREGEFFWDKMVKPGIDWFLKDRENRRVVFLASEGFDTDIKDQDNNDIPTRFPDNDPRDLCRKS